jgi:Mn2+/Fe2+ NRAMP family transporter
MVGDNDAGAFGTYTQAGQDYGTGLLWTLLLLVPVLSVNQEMVLRLGAVTGVGHARLILERFGKFWGAFSVIDLFSLNALTIVTEFIGISLALDYLGLPRELGVIGRRRSSWPRREPGIFASSSASRCCWCSAACS